MEGSKDDTKTGPVANSIMALKNKFDNKPETAVKPSNIKYGGGGALNVFAAGAADVKPPANEKNLKDKPNSNSTIPNGTAERSSKLNIPSAFREATPPEKPQLAVKPLRKQSTSDANNNPQSPVEPKAAGVRGISGMFETKKPEAGDAKMTSPRGGGNVSAIAGELFKDKSPLDLKSGLRKVSDAKFKFEKEPDKSENQNAPKQLDFRKNLHHHVDKPANTPSKPWQRRVSLTRQSDGKTFKKVEKFSVVKPVGKGPEKPAKLDIEIDFESLALDFKECLEVIESGKSAAEPDWGDDQETYDDVGVDLRQKLTREPSERAVSLIPEMTDEEEAEWNQAGFPGLIEENEELPPPPDFIQEVYDDVAVRPQGDEENEELYEPLPDEMDLPFLPGEEPPPPLGPKPMPPPVSNIHNEAPAVNGEVETPAERKKREKAEKEAKAKKEKELKKKERELAKLMKDYKITAEQLATSVSKGQVKLTQKGSHKLDVSVTEGDRVEIIRMVDNVKGRWLIRIDSSGKDRHEKGKPYSPLDLIGYCDSNNIQVDTDIIKTVMKGNVSSPKSVPSLPGPIEQETYEDVDGAGAGDELIEEEIYEQCD